MRKNILILGVLLAVFMCSSCAEKSFRELAEKKDLETGMAVAIGDLFVEEHINILKENCSVLVAENCMKWATVRPTKKLWNWSDVDNLVKFAQENGMDVKWHTLFWHNQNSPVVASIKTKEDALALMDEYIETVMTRYKGKIKEYDVVNEMFNEDGSFRDTPWYRAIGKEYIEHALIKAREADADALLFLNEFNNEEAGHPKADAMYNLAKELKEKGVPLDGIGMQLHLDASLYFNPDGIRENVRRYADLGLQVSFSEVDVRIPTSNPEEWRGKQQEVYETLLRIALEEPNVTSFIMWGFTDKQSWVPSTFPGTGEALPYDAKLNPKPLYEGMKNILKE